MAAPTGPRLLGPELLGRVLDLLPRDDLQSARLAARIFDKAPQKHTGRATILYLAPDTASIALNTAGRRGPSWARLPRLRHLVLRGWDAQGFTALREAMASVGDGDLDGIEEVRADFCCYALDAPTWASVLRRTPYVAELLPGPCNSLDADANIASIAAIAALAPHLKRLDAMVWELDAVSLAIIAAGMRSLEYVRLNWGVGPWTHAARVAAASRLWEALPCASLTELVSVGVLVKPAPPPAGSLWPRLRALSGVSLPGTQAAALAGAMPGLQRLSARPNGDWDGLELPSGAALQSLTCLQVYSICGSFCRAAPLPRLFPALERLDWGGGSDAAVERDIPGLTMLTHLELTDTWQRRIMVSCALSDRMHLLCRLRLLKIQVARGELPLLARLPPGLTALDISVALWRDEGGSFDWGHDAVDDERFDVCGILEAAARGVCLRDLRIHAPGAARLSHASFVRLVTSGVLASLEELVLLQPRVLLHDVSVLAMLAGLRQLTVIAAKG